MKEQVKGSLPRLSRGTKTPAMHFGVAVLAAVALVIAFQQDAVVRAQDVMRPLTSLKTVPTPEPANLGKFVRDRAAAIVLGKALFWDQQVGSDGQACASCHFHAGADSRSKNQLDPGLRAVPQDFNFTPPFGPNYQVKANDFPFHRLANPDDRDSAVLFDTNDIMSSQGVRNFTFTAIVPGRRNDAGIFVADPIFNVGQVNVRQVEPRNTPTMINAVFNHRNFWDGRARNEFNGVSPIGDLDPDVFVLRATANRLEQVQLRRDKHPDLVLEDSSLASQAVGPPLSNLEMSYAGRTFPAVGKKMVPRRALALQQVSREDSVLGPYSRSPMPGINKHYRELIQAAFQPEWWQSNMLVRADGSIISSHQGEGAEADDEPSKRPADQFTLMEFNFSLFWGLAIQMFEATLVANDSKVDQFFDGNTMALNPQEQLGMQIFQTKGKCFNCHGGPELTNASVVNVRDNEMLERMIMGDNNVAVYDNGFYNISVTDTKYDIGVGATIGPRNLPLSTARFFQMQTPQDNCHLGNAAGQTGCLNAPPIKPRPGVPSGLLQPTERVAVDGAQKTPGLRNVELTAPYFHNGGMSTLEQVVEFYNRGGNFAKENKDNFDTDIEPLGLTADEKAALVAFLKALTDERVRFDKAPFDHPQLIVPNGARGNQVMVRDDGTGNAKEDFLRIPAVGKNGLKAPSPNFLEMRTEGEEEETNDSDSGSGSTGSGGSGGGAGGSGTITTVSLPNGTVGTAYSATLQSGGGTPPVSWTVTIGTLPAGLSLNSSTGAISGTPTTVGTSNLTVQATDSGSPAQTATKALSITINPASGGGSGGSGGSATGVAASVPFQMLGPIQRATLDSSTDKLSGGTITVEGITVIVPRNTIVKFPNTFTTWGEVFTLAPAGTGNLQTGLALADSPPPLAAVQVEVAGNFDGKNYIAGLVSIKQTANAGQGIINFIDLSTGEMRVGGAIGDGTTGARVRLNDPIGRFGRVMTPDVRFTIDEDNPTVRATTGYPMCMPRTDVAAGAADDPLCPQGNRPKDLTGAFLAIFTMPPPPGPGMLPDPTRQAPLEVGDFVTYSGLLAKDTTGSTYVSADTVIADLGIYTTPGTKPAYVAIFLTIIGVIGDPNSPLAQEVTLRTRYEGFTTDSTQPVDVFAVDVQPCTGAVSDRLYGTAIPDTVAQKGRWRFRPGNKNPSFQPATREVRAVSRTGVASTPVANGLIAGQYRLPNDVYVFPERVTPGAQQVPLPFENIPFLVNGSGPFSGAGRVGQLSPFPVSIPGAAPPTALTCGP